MLMHTALRYAARNYNFILTLFFIFVSSFFLPFVFARGVGKFFPAWLSISENQQNAKNLLLEEEKLFGTTININRAGAAVKLSSSAGVSLAPMLGEDYIVSFWIKPSRLPQASEKILIAGLSDFSPSSKEGFLFGLKRDEQQGSAAIRPIVFWGDGSSGQWFTFSEMDLLPQTWALFVISFSEDRYLGLHMASLSATNKPNVRILGGYEVATGTLAKSPQPLRLGSVNKGRFRGKLGPLGILSGPGIASDITNIVEEMAAQPKSAPSKVKSQHVRAWVASIGSDEKLTSGLKLDTNTAR